MCSSFRKVSEVSGTRKLFKLTRLEITFLFAESCSWCPELPLAHPNTHLLWDPAPDMNCPLCTSCTARSWKPPACFYPTLIHQGSSPWPLPDSLRPTLATVSLMQGCEGRRLTADSSDTNRHSTPITCKIFKAVFTSFIQTTPVQASH